MGKYKGSVHFATSAAPRIVATFRDEVSALREARSYLSDAQAVLVIYPNGATYDVKTGERKETAR